jgi:hypothetical protein
VALEVRPRGSVARQLRSASLFLTAEGASSRWCASHVELYKPDWKAWFGDEGGNRDGGPNDPRFALILIDATSVVYGKRNKPKPLALFEVVKGIVTGKEPDVSDVRRITARELEGPRSSPS